MSVFAVVVVVIASFSCISSGSGSCGNPANGCGGGCCGGGAGVVGVKFGYW